MKKLFRKYAELNKWANNKLRKTMEELTDIELQLKTPYGSILDLTIHLINAINHWLDFFDETYKIPRSKDDINYDNWREVLLLWQKTDERFERIIENFTNDQEFENFFIYSHDKKTKYKMKFSELFTHLTCHSYYHRGQLVMVFRQNKLPIAPPIDVDNFFKIQLN